MEFLSWLRDALTLLIFVSLLSWLSLHEFVLFVRSLFIKRQEENKAIANRKRFNGSAAVWVK